MNTEIGVTTSSSLRGHATRGPKQPSAVAMSLMLLFLLLTSCTSPQKRLQGAGPRERVFPDGTYRHAVTIHMPDGATPSFDGVVRLSPATITVVGMASLGTTVFRITEDRASGKITTAIHHPPLERHEAKITEFYRILRQLLLLKAPARDRATIPGPSYEVDVLFFAIDDNGIPGMMEIRHPKFTVMVKMVGYDA